MAAFIDACRFTPTAGGTTDWTVSAAVQGYMTPAGAGASNARLYKYRAESADLTQWEIGEGAYTSAGTVLARTTVLFNSSGTTSKINFSAAPQVAVVALREDLISIEEANSFTTAQKSQAQVNIGVRTVLTAGASYFVNASTGNDSNDGLTSGTAFATLQKAMDVIAMLDCSIYGVTVNVANGTYAALILKSYIGTGIVQFLGNTSTPSSCVISSAGGAVSTTAFGGNFLINGFRLQSSGAQDVFVGSPTTVTLQNCEYNGSSGNYRLYVSSFGVLICSGASHKILTGGIGLFLVGDGAAKLSINSATFTLGASVTYTGATFNARRGGYCECAATVFTVGAFTVTGPRYNLSACSVTAGTGGSATFFPGSSVGSADGTCSYG